MNYVLYYKIALYIGISLEVMSYGTLCKYSLTVDPNQISFLCINLISYLHMVFIKLLFVFNCHDSLFTVVIVCVMTNSVYTWLDLWNTE
jgi:hypothetical protein